MTVRVSKKDRKKIDKIKKMAAGPQAWGFVDKEIVLDDSYKDIKKEGYIYESPDRGKTIYRRAASYCDVSGVKIDEPEQLEFNFNKLEEQLTENDVNAQIANLQGKLFKMSTLIDELAEGIKKIRDNN